MADDSHDIMSFAPGGRKMVYKGTHWTEVQSVLTDSWTPQDEMFAEVILSYPTLTTADILDAVGWAFLKSEIEKQLEWAPQSGVVIAMPVLVTFSGLLGSSGSKLGMQVLGSVSLTASAPGASVPAPVTANLLSYSYRLPQVLTIEGAEVMRSGLSVSRLSTQVPMSPSFL